MAYKLKFKPEDFIVKENSSLAIKSRGDYSVFLLRKTGLNTDDIVRILVKENRIKSSLISYAGRKDRHSISEQLITIKGNHKNLSYKKNCFELSFVGYSDEPISPRHIASNSFKVTIRNIDASFIRPIEDRIKRVTKIGFLNYFDEQRFRSFDELQGFVAEKILKGHYNGALKIIMTSIRDEDRKRDKERKKGFIQYWGQWEKCLEHSATDFEKRVFRYLVQNKNGALNILRSIDRRELSMYFSTYQSYLFNEVLKRVVKRVAKSIIEISSTPTHIYLLDEIELHQYEYLKNLQIPLIAQRIDRSDKIVSEFYDEIMEERNLKYSMFNLRKIRKAYFKSTLRKAIVFPEKTSFAFEEDDIFKSKIKLILYFELPSGSYGTMFIKHILT
ncbi:MAG: tRNA pseudouridine(13) synthase TruD [Deltaproteobacteria bacterium]|nr:tRNA pseudouridine(13) synthase TruD [Deltaproteobacteria bacterium]